MLYALAIGIDEYIDPSISNLNYACNDAKEFATLIERGIYAKDRQVNLLLNSEATVKNIRSAIGEMLPRVANSEEDVVILFFAGHGSPETELSVDETSRYLVAHDTEYDRVYSTGIDMDREVTRWFQRIAAPKLLVFFVDACFSGRAGGRTFEGPTLKKKRSKYRSGPLRLRKLKLGEGRAILTACDDNQLATETARLRHGVFTHGLLTELSSFDAAETSVGLGELYESVRRHVLTYTNGRQQPVLNGRVAGARLPRLKVNL